MDSTDVLNEKSMIYESCSTVDATRPSNSCLVNQITQLTNEVRDAIESLRPLVQKLLQIEMNPSTRSSTESESAQMNSYSNFQLIRDPSQSITRPNEISESQMMLQPTFIHDYSLNNQYFDLQEIMVEGYEETCAYINDIRKKFTDADRANELPYIQYRSRQVEKVFIANYTALALKLNKSMADELMLEKFDESKFPTFKGDDYDSFYYWLKRLVWYKHTYFIPDYLIRDTLLDATLSLNKPDLTMVVRSSCKLLKHFLSSPIRYDLIFSLLKVFIIDDKNIDIIDVISDVIHLGWDPKSTMLTICAEMDVFIRTKESKELLLITWVQLFKMLFEELEEIMDQIIAYMKPIVRVARPKEQEINTIVELDGFEIKAHLELIKKCSQEQVLAMKMAVTFGEIWEAVSVTYTQRITHIHLLDKPKKPALRSTKSCPACGKFGHKLVKCYSVRGAVRDGLVFIKNGHVYSSSGEQLKLNKSEVMVKKYANLFQRRT